MKSEIKNEIPTWKIDLSTWRIANKYTSDDWNNYAKARTDQLYIFSACIGLMSFGLGYVLGGM